MTILITAFGHHRVASAILMATILAGIPMNATAHRSGCHRWHSCPSDTGSYVCGDLGHCSGCSDNAYCLLGKLRSATAEQAKPEDDPKSRGGVAPTDAWNCPATHPIKGNFTTYSRERCISHPPGGAFYDKTKPERCYATEAEARRDGCRPSRR